jgi:small subunit ribosomal protein S16
MSVKLRMTRMGRRHRPFFRLNAVESTTPRDGKILEKLGHYDPIEKDSSKATVLNMDRIKFWLEAGAVPSDTVSEMLARAGLKTKFIVEKEARHKKAREIARKAKRPYTKAEKIAAGHIKVDEKK